jgi:hypothetical protein
MWEERRGRGGVLGLEYGLDVYSTQFAGDGNDDGVGGGGGNDVVGGTMPGQLGSPGDEGGSSFAAQRAEELRLAFNTDGDAMYVYGEDGGFQPLGTVAAGVREEAEEGTRGWNEAWTEEGRGDSYRIDIADR